MNDEVISRRLLLKRPGALGLLAALQPLLPSCVSYPLPSITRPSSDTPKLSGELIDLVISERSFALNGHTGTATTINGTIPGPLIRLKEGQEGTLTQQAEI
jgi:FtsP/CotA-like multicopper oxidase with cupredoxin domain